MIKEIPEATIAALKVGNKVRAVKVTREDQNLSLRAALESVDGYLASNPAVNEQYIQMHLRAGRKYSLILKIGLALLGAGAVAAYFGH